MWGKRRAPRSSGNDARPEAALGDADGDGDDCEAFLAGQYAEWLLRRRQPVPPWAWLNQAAHAAPMDVLFAATLPPAAATSPWTAARRAIAIDVLRAVRDVDQLDALRRQVLVPLELDLARAALEPPLSPTQLVALVSTTLEAEVRNGR